MQIDPAFGLLTTDKAILRAAKQVVASALDATSSIDPIIGPGFSRAFSFFNLVVQRHGLLIQRVLGGHFEVLTESPIPITAAALDLLLSENSEKDLASIRLKSDSRVERSVMMDIVVIDEAKRWAGVYDVKRGNGETTWKTRKPIENDLRAARLVLQSHLKKLGHDVDHVDSAVIDYLRRGPLLGGKETNKPLHACPRSMWFSKSCLTREAPSARVAFNDQIPLAGCAERLRNAVHAA